MNTQHKTPSGKYVTIKPKREKVNRSTGEKVIIWIVFVILAVYAFTLIYPFFYLIINTFRINGKVIRDGQVILEGFRSDPLGLPSLLKYTEKYTDKNGNVIEKTLPAWVHAFKHNYGYVFNDPDGKLNIPAMFFNSVLLSVGQTVVGMTITCMAAYVLAKYKFKGNNFIYVTTIVASMVPTVGSAAATYKLMYNAKFIADTSPMLYNYLGVLLMVGAFGGPFLYLHSFFKAIPWSYGESAQLDGASDFRIFVQIMLPLASNGVLTFTIMRFLGSWNEYWHAYLYFGNYRTLAVGLAEISNDLTKLSKYTELFATMIITVIPVIIFYAIFQKQLMRNTIGGGLKG